MACITEALGMSLHVCATALAVSAKKKRFAYESGMRVVKLVEEGLSPGKIMTRAAFENAIRIDMALGGSINAPLHILAIAKEAGIEFQLELFDKISRETPHLTALRPGGDYFMEDLEFAGGIPGRRGGSRPPSRKLKRRNAHLASWPAPSGLSCSR